MVERKVTGWFTMNGKHIPIFEGESKQDAVIRAVVKANEDKKNIQIAKNKEQVDKIKSAKSVNLSDKKDLNSFETWQSIGRHGFSDVKVRFDGQIVGKDATKPGGSRELSKGFGWSYKNDGTSAVVFNLTTNSDYFNKILDNQSKLTIENKELSDKLAPTLTKRGFTLVGTSEPKGYMAYSMWEKKKK